MNKNVLILLVDQWRAECFGFKNHKFVKTPNIDKLALHSVNFSNSHTVTPLCSPARGCLLTSLVPHINGVIDNLYVGASKQKPLSDCNDTWLKAAARNGFCTAYFGKWHLGEWDPQKYGITTDVFKQELSNKNKSFAMANSRGELLPDAIKRKTVSWKADENIDSGKLPYYGIRPDESTAPDHIACENTIEYLSKTSDKAWCVTMSLRSPHFPLSVPEPFYSMYNANDMVLPESFNDHFVNKPWFQNRHWWPSMNTDYLSIQDWKKTIAAYYGMISYTDFLIGRALDAAIKYSGGRPTTVIFTSDHGEMMGCHSRFDKGAYFYDEVMRTPLLLCSDINDNSIKSSTRKEYCSSSDIGATIFDLVGAQAPSGRSLVKLIQNCSNSSWPDEAYGSYYKYNGHSFEVRTITTPRFKYSYVPQDIDELYDLENDPCEMVNLSDNYEYLSVKTSLREKLFNKMKTEGDYLLDRKDSLVNAGTIIN